MVNPALTIVFDLFLIGAATAVIASMVREYLTNRAPAVGRGRSESIATLESHARAVVAPRGDVGSRRRRQRQAALRHVPTAPAEDTRLARGKRRDMAQVI